MMEGMSERRVGAAFIEVFAEAYGFRVRMKLRSYSLLLRETSVLTSERAIF